MTVERQLVHRFERHVADRLAAHFAADRQVGGDDRRPAGQRLDDRQSEAFVLGGQQHEGGSADRRPRAYRGRGTGARARGGARRDRPASRSWCGRKRPADAHQPEVRSSRSSRRQDAEEHVDALPLDRAPDVQQVDRSGPEERGGARVRAGARIVRARGVHAERYDAQPVGIDELVIARVRRASRG